MSTTETTISTSKLRAKLNRCRNSKCACVVAKNDQGRWVRSCKIASSAAASFNRNIAAQLERTPR